MIKKFLWMSFIFLFFLSCSENQKGIFIPEDIIIAHRGTTFWAPEETEAAYRWARNIGAHYLEVDIQRSKDGVLMALHDNQLTRTTDISQIYSERDTCPSSEFNFEELLILDAGSWFNIANPERANIEFSFQAIVIKSDRKAFYFNDEGQKIFVDIEDVYSGGKQQILALEDVIRIAEGCRIAKDVQGNRLFEKYEKDGITKYRFFYVDDGEDNGNRPGIYIETKEPQLFPGIEKDLYDELDRLGWNQLTKPSVETRTLKNSKVNIANTSAKIILQTFSPQSLEKLYKYFKGNVPTTFLLWLGELNMKNDDATTYARNLEFAKEYGAQIIGPSIGGEPNNYADLLKEEDYQLIKKNGFLIHPYSFDTEEQTFKYGKLCDGMFTNRAELTINYYSKR